MYKKISLFSLLLFSLTQYATDAKPWLEIKPSYFFFSQPPMNEIYNNGGFEIQGSASVPLCQYLDIYGSIGYRHASGNALNGFEITNLTVMPIDIGLKPVFNFSERFNYFFAMGPRYFYFNQQNNSPFIDPVFSGSGLGFFANTGLNVLLADCFLLGVFGEYSYENKVFHPKMPHVYSDGPVQIGGFAFGVSLGYAF